MEKFKNPTTYLITIGAILCLSIVAYYQFKTTALKIPLKEIDKHLGYQEEKKFDCVEEYEQLLTSNPNSYEANYLLANLLYVNKSVKDSAKIENLFLKAYSLNNKDFKAVYVLSKIYHSKKDYYLSREYAKKALVLNPSSNEIKKFIEKIDADDRLDYVTTWVINQYESDMVNESKSISELADIYYVDEKAIGVIISQIDEISKSVSTINYKNKPLSVKYIKNEYQKVLDMISWKKEREERENTVDLYCSSGYQKDFLKGRLQKFDISVLYLLRRLNDCSYLWETILDNVDGVPMAFQISTGINDKTLEVDILWQKRVN